MGKLSELGTKATPVGADLLTGLDSEDSNIQTKNKNFLLSSLWSAIFGTRDTDDIPEGTNLYYTDARVDANGTVVSKENLSNKSTDTALGTSDTLYPTQNAVKFYVDNQGINVNGLSEDTAPEMESDFNLEYDVSTGINKKYKMSSYRATDVESGEMITDTKFIVPTQLAGETQIITRLLNISSSVVVYNHSLGRKPRKIRFSFDSVGGGTGAGIYLTNDGSNRVVGNNSSNSLCIDQSNVTGVVTGVTATTYTISWTNTTSTSATMNILVDLD